jgi:diguanylate cyclase (GGDEF)-like protein
MKRLIPAVAILLGWASAAWAAAPVALTTLRAISALTNAQASQKLPVAFEATVTYYRKEGNLLFVQDGGDALFVLSSDNEKLVHGDRILIKGVTRESFRPIVVSNDLTVLRHGELPKPLFVNYGDLILGQHDCLLVTMRGQVRAADLFWSPTALVHSITLQILTRGGYIEATLDGDNLDALSGLLDAEVEVTGTSGGIFDGKMQQTGIKLHVPSAASIKVLKPAKSGIWDTPVTPMNQILSGYQISNFTPRVRVQGVITLYQPGSAVVLQGGGRSLWIRTRTVQPLRVGDLADATGYPDVIDGFLTLTHSEINDRHEQAPIAPVPVVWEQLAVTGNQGVGHHYDLISIEGQVLTQARVGAQDEYVVVADGHPFSAVYRHPSGPLEKMKQIPQGSKVRVTGICTVHDSSPFNGPVAFDILLRSFDDIEVIKKAPFLNVRNLMLIVSLLLVVVTLVGARGWTLERKVRQKTAALAVRIEAEAALERRSAQLEQQRSRILEDINGSRPLAEILEEITKLVSFEFHGAACWCEVTDGARLGDPPPKADGPRIARAVIPARSGPPLGVLFVAPGPAAETRVQESEALAIGTELATLAIETRRLYSDLLRRSEFDLLTDAHNRFSLEKHLDAQIEEARANAAVFGLIYIDLDGFKQVNDLHGHHVGDLYLQEIARRMKQQLRSHDLLARLGGDEFAVLLPKVRNRAGVEEISLRLENCFNDPLELEGRTLQGSASFGLAVYPEDSATGDGLLSAADAAMYAAKNTKRQIEKILNSSLHVELSS